MSVRVLRAAAISALLIATACSSGNSSSTPAIALGHQSSGTSYVEVIGLSAAHLRAVRAAALTDEQWARLFRVAVSDTAPGMLGTYSVTDSELRFTPQFELDAGRPYHRPIRSVASAGSGRRRRACHRRHCHRARDPRRAFNDRRARLSVWRCRARKPAADVCRVLGADGTPQRHPAHEVARLGWPRDRGGVPAARLRVLGSRAYALHRRSSIPDE